MYKRVRVLINTIVEFPPFSFLLLVRRDFLEISGSVLMSKTPLYIKYSRALYLLQERSSSLTSTLLTLSFLSD
jgi:hypothetical protein